MNKKNVVVVISLFVGFFLCLLFYSQRESSLKINLVDSQKDMKVEKLLGVRAYLSLIESKYGDHRPARGGVVPALFAVNLPGDLGELLGAEKSETFIELLIPEVIRANDSVLSERKILQGLIAKKARVDSLQAPEKLWLTTLTKKYGVVEGNMDALLKRVDSIPASLVLAQAITESGWGTSRFARLGNALYGQHVPAASDAPHILSKSGNVKVAAFDSLYDATVSYINNLNSHGAYKELRKLRAQSRLANKPPHGRELAGGLLAYSQIGSRYVQDLRLLISKYKLEDFDGAVLNNKEQGVAIVFAR